MVETDVIALPAFFVVALLALLALLAVMLVVLLVARIALGWRLVAEAGRGMAFIALGILVLEFQRVLGVLIMIETGFFPALFVVTLLAFLTQVAMVPLVVISFLVTVIANILQFLLIQLAGMALVALDFKMLEAQRVFRILVVVEKALLPVVFLVAAFAFLAEIALMRLFVVLLVARPAIQR